MSQYGMPQLPFMPFAGGPGSVAGSDYGGQMVMPQLPYQNTGGSLYGMMPNAPGNASLNMFGGGVAPPATPGGMRPMSTFSMATSVNPFAGPSMNPDPTDEDLFNALRNYLSTQDLMTVTKK
jgi:chitin synthase